MVIVIVDNNYKCNGMHIYICKYNHISKYTKKRVLHNSNNNQAMLNVYD